MAWIDKRRTDFSAEEKKKKEEQARSQQQAQQEWAQPRSTNASSGAVSSPGTKASSSKSTTSGKKTTSGGKSTSSGRGGSSGSSGSSSGGSKPSYNKVSLAGTSGFGAYSAPVWNTANPLTASGGPLPLKGGVLGNASNGAASLVGRSGFGAYSAPVWNAAAQAAQNAARPPYAANNSLLPSTFANSHRRTPTPTSGMVQYGQTVDINRTLNPSGINWDVRPGAPSGRIGGQTVTGRVIYSGEDGSDMAKWYDAVKKSSDDHDRSKIWTAGEPKAIQKIEAGPSKPTGGERGAANLGGFIATLNNVWAKPVKFLTDWTEDVSRFINSQPDRQKAHDDLKRAIDENVSNTAIRKLLHAVTGTRHDNAADELNGINLLNRIASNYVNDSNRRLQDMTEVNRRADATSNFPLTRLLYKNTGMGLNEAAGNLIDNTARMAADLFISYAVGAVMGTGDTVAAASKEMSRIMGAKNAAQGAMATAANVAENVAKSPMFWPTLSSTLPDMVADSREAMHERTQRYGESYTIGKDLVAVSAATLASLVSSAVEVGGTPSGHGVETYVKKLGVSKKSFLHTVWDWAWEAGGSEGAEEIVQGAVERQMKNALAGRFEIDDAFSLTNPDAVINPYVMAQEFGMGALTGLAIGGGSTLINAAGNKIERERFVHSVGRAINESGMAEDVMRQGLNTDAAGRAFSLADKLSRRYMNGVMPSDHQMGRQFVRNMEADARTASLADAIRERTGATISRTDSARDNGYVNTGTREIFINPDTDRTVGDTAVSETLKHETTHLAEKYAPEQYRRYQAHVLNAAIENNADAVEARRSKLLEYPEYNESNVDAELAAELSEPLLKNDALISAIARRKPDFAEKMSDVIASAAAHLRDLRGKPYRTQSGLELTYRQIHDAELMWREALRNVPEKNVGESEAGEIAAFTNEVRYAKNSKENASIRQQLRNSEDRLNAIEPIGTYMFQINDSIPNNQKRQSVLNEYLKIHSNDGNSVMVHREGFGDIDAGRKVIKKGFTYLTSNSELTAILAVPDIIRNGLIINEHNEHKGREYSTVTFAAPIVLNGVKGNMGVTVKLTDRYKYKMHRIILPDKKVVEFEDNINDSSYNVGTTDINIGGTPTITTAINNSVSQPDGIVNTQDDIKFSRKASSPGRIVAEPYAGALDESRLTKKELYERMDSAYSLVEKYVRSNAEEDYNAAADSIMGIAEDIVSSSYGEMGDTEQRNELRKELYGRRIYVSPSSKSTGELGADGYSEFRRRAFGAGITLVNDPANGAGAESLYSELRGRYPQYLPEAATPEEAINNIVDFMTQRPQAERLYKPDDAQQLMVDIINELGNIAVESVPEAERARAKETVKAAAGRLSNLYTVSGQNKHYSSEFRKALEKKKEKFRYNPKAIGPQYESAQAMIEEEGADTVLNAFFRDQQEKPWVSESVATAAALIEHYTQAGDHDTAADIFVFARPYATRAGQASQAWALINRLSKEGKIMAVSRENIKRKEDAIDEIEKKKAKGRAAKQQFQTELDEARRRDRKAREEKDSAAEVEPPTPPTEEGAYKEEPIPPRNGAKPAESGAKPSLGDREPQPEPTRERPSLGTPYGSGEQGTLDIEEPEQPEPPRERPSLGTPFRKVGQPGFNERAVDTETGEAAVKEAQRRLGEDINAIRAGNTEADNAKFERELGEARRADAENDKAADWFRVIEDEAERQWRKTKLGRKGAPDPRSFEEKVLDRWAGRGKVGSANYIPHQVLDYALETLDEIERLKEKGGKEEFIAKIIKLSEHRHTAGNQFNILKGRLEKYDVEPLTEMATMQVFGLIADTKKTSFWQYLSTAMAIGDLVKATTMGRNVLSNAVFSTVEKTSNNLAILPDILMSLRTGNRTVGFQSGVFGKGVLRSNLKERLDWARDAYIDIALGINRANYSESRWGMDSSRRTFKGQNVPGRIYASLERGMGYGLNVTDQWTKGGLYNRTKRSLADLKGTPFTAEEIEELAMEEALYATFQDDNFISRRLIAIRNALNGSVNFGLGDVVIKYAQVPGSLIMRSLEYSPAGAFKAMLAIGQAVMEARSIPSADGKKRHISAARQRQIALTVGRLMNTTILVAMGALMHSLGIITGAESEDKDAKDLEKSEGLGQLQLNMSALGRLIGGGFLDPKKACELQNGDTLMQLSWMQPMNTLLEMGVSVSKQNWGGTGSILGDIGQGAANIFNISKAVTFEQLLDMPALSAVMSFARDVNYGKSGIDIAVGTVADTAMRFAFGPAKQIAKGADMYQRNPYNEGSELESTIANMASSLPFLSKNVPASVNKWGEKRKKGGNVLWNIVNELIMPGKVSIYQTNGVSDEIKKLASVDADVIPPKVETHFTEKLPNGDQVYHDITGKDYETYSINMGQNIARALSELFRSEEYAELDDVSKAEKVKQALMDAKELTRNEYAAAQRGEKYREAAKLVGQDIVDKIGEDMKKIEFQSDTGAKYMDINGIKYQLSDKLLGEMNDIITSKTNEYRQKIVVDGAKIEDVFPMKVKKLMYYNDMSDKQRADSEKNMTEDEKQAFRSGTLAKEKDVQITGSLYDYDTETRQKILNKIDSKAKEDAQNAIKSRVPTEGTPMYKLYQSRGFTERDSENPAEIYPKPEHHVKQKAVKPERSTDWGRVMELLGMNGTSARAEDKSVEYKGKSLGIDLNKVPQFTAVPQHPGIGEARPTAEPTPKPTLAAARPQPTFTPTPTAEPQQTAARPSIADARTVGFGTGGAMPTLTAAANASRPSLGDTRPADFNSGGAVPILTSTANYARQEAATPQYAVPTWRATPSTAAHRPSLGQGRTVTGLIIEPERETVQAAAPSTTTTARAGSRRSSSGGSRSGGGRRSSSGGRSSTARSTAPSLGAASRSYSPALDAPRAGSAVPSLEAPSTAERSYAPTLASASAERRAAESYRQRGYTPAAAAGMASRFISRYYMPLITGRRISDIVGSNFRLTDASGAPIDLSGYFSDLSEQEQSLLLDELQRRAEGEEVVV